MSMYLPNRDLNPTGYEPAEYLDAPFIGDGPPAANVDPRRSPAPARTPMANTPVPQDDPDSGDLPVPEDRRRWLVRLAASARSGPVPRDGRVHHFARRPPRWWRALASRERR